VQTVRTVASLGRLHGLPCRPVFAGYLKHALLDADSSISVASPIEYL
jgi:hypothetical protein